MKSEVIERVAALLTAAFGLVAALAWNDAIKALFVGPCGSESAGALCSLSSGGPWVFLTRWRNESAKPKKGGRSSCAGGGIGGRDYMAEQQKA